MKFIIKAQPVNCSVEPQEYTTDSFDTAINLATALAYLEMIAYVKIIDWHQTEWANIAIPNNVKY